MKRFWFALLVVLVATASAQKKAATAIGVKAGKVLDIRTGNYSTDQMIWIEGDRIKAVGKSSQIESQLPSDAKIIDLSTATILPGLVDCHMHLTFDPNLFGPAGLSISYPRSALIGARNARATLEAGFTTVRNLGADGYSDIALRDAVNAGDVPGPRILASGPPLSVTGGHWDEDYLAPQFAFSKEGVADGVDEVIKKVRENVKYGADVIKVMATGGIVSQGHDNPTATQYNLEEMKAIVETAHNLGLKVAAHAHGALGIKYAVLAGVDSVEHGSYINDEQIDLMKHQGTYLVPTVYLDDWILQNVQNLGWSADTIAKAKTLISNRENSLAHAFRSGVKVALGSDAGVYPHGLNAHELAKMVEMGLTPLQAIQAGTVNAADLLGWTDRIGTIEPGKWADIIAVDADPLRDVMVLEHVKFVMKGGEVIKDEYAK